jgi:4'-phosphopantetheinyl transferase
MAPTWILPPPMLQLHLDEVHVWRAWLDLPPLEIVSIKVTVSNTEMERAEKFHFQNDRNRFIAAHSYLRQVLARYLDLEPDEICYTYNEHGKPELDPGFDQLRFNLSHSKSVGLIAVTMKSRIGVDVELIKHNKDIKQIAQRFFSPGEIEQLLNQPDSQHDEAFFRCWTRKEAYLKALGVGMLIPLNQFEVDFAPGVPPRIKHTVGKESEAARWSLYHINPKEKYIGALAVEGKSAEIRFFQMTGWPGS